MRVGFRDLLGNSSQAKGEREDETCPEPQTSNGVVLLRIGKYDADCGSYIAVHGRVRKEVRNCEKFPTIVLFLVGFGLVFWVVFSPHNPWWFILSLRM